MTARELLHMGSRAAVDQALSRLARSGSLMRAGRGIYVRPVESRFGAHPPEAATVVDAIAAQNGERVAPHGATAANELGLTTQVPTREIYRCISDFGVAIPALDFLLVRHPAAFQVVVTAVS